MGSKRSGQFTFFVYSDDHDPMHVHAWIGSKQIAKIEITGEVVRAIKAYGNVSEVRKALRTASEIHGELIVLWRKIYG